MASTRDQAESGAEYARRFAANREASERRELLKRCNPEAINAAAESARSWRKK